MPLLDVAGALRDQGHECVLLVPPSLIDAASRSEFRVVGGAQPSAEVVEEIWERVRRGPPRHVVGLVDRELFAELAADAMVGAAEELCANFVPDLVVRESCEYATSMTAHRRAIPQAQVGVSAAVIDAGVLEDVAASLDDRCPGVSGAIRSAPYLTAFAEVLDPSPWRRTIRYRHVPQPANQLPEWWPGRETQPLVYMTFGSVLGGMKEAGSVFRVALDAVSELPIRVLMTVGRSFDLTQLGPVPSNAHLEPWVPQADIFAAAPLVVCHGGSGTTNGALSAGLPLVICPLFADQNRNADTVQRVGAGTVVRSRSTSPGGVASLDQADAPKLTDAIAAALDTPSYRRAAQDIAASTAATSTLPEAVRSLQTVAADPSS